MGGVAVRWIESSLIFPEGDNFGLPFRLREDQKRFLWEWYSFCPECAQWHYDEGVRGAATGDGKALALDTPVPTPSGWTTMGELQPGDEVFDERGQRCAVTYVSPVFVGNDCYEVVFSDGERIVADADHLWAVEEKTPKGHHLPCVKTTRELASVPVRLDSGRLRYRLQMPGPLNLPEADLPVDPYILGTWIGDGDSADSNLTLHVDDLPELRANVDAAGYHLLGIRSDPRSPNTVKVRLSLTPGKGNFRRDGERLDTLKGRLRALGVLGNKHIPPRYLRASEKQRLALLQGLMDTDGSISARGQCEFTSTRREIADGAAELLVSLGMKCRVLESRATLRGKDCGPKYRIMFEPVDVPVFRLTRKLARVKRRGATAHMGESRRIVEINPVPTVPTRCIQVDSPSRLYRVGRRMVQTHNTTFIAAIALLEFAGPPQIAPISPLIDIAAASYDQADELFGKAGQMVGGRDDEITEAPLCGFFQVYDKVIKFRDGRPGEIRRVAAVAGTNEGGLPHLFICDEVHEWGDVGSNKARVHTVISKSTRKRNTRRGAGRVLNLSTAGFDVDHSLLGAMYKRGLRALQDPSTAPRLLFDWQEAPEGLDYDNPEDRAKAVRAASAGADVMWKVADRVNDWGKPSMPRHEWLRYFANKWVGQADESWLKEHAGAWEACRGDAEIPQDASVVVAVDMALRRDSIAVVTAWKRPDGRVAVQARIWNPDGGKLDHLAVVDYIRHELTERFQIAEITYDPRFFEVPARMLEDEGFNLVEFPQSPERMAPACGQALEAIVGGLVVHDGDPDLAAHVKAAVMKANERGFTLSKGRSKRKIDACIALVIALWRVLAPDPEEEEADPWVVFA